MKNIVDIAYSVAYSLEEEGISLGMRAAKKGYTSFIRIDGLLGYLVLIIWAKDSKNLSVVNEDFIVGDLYDSNSDLKVEELIESLESLGQFERNGYTFQVVEKI
jgi:hypothetical protein